MNSALEWKFKLKKEEKSPPLQIYFRAFGECTLIGLILAKYSES